jgi:Ca-activated chloride channel family protein
VDHKAKAIRLFLFPLLLCAALFISVPSLSAQQPGPMKPPVPPKAKPPANQVGPVLRRSVDMVLVPVTVVDPYDRLVTGLEQDNFRVYEDGEEQEVTHFSEEDVPISIGVIFDMSGSMSDKINKSKMAALQFFKTANPQDEFFLVDFSDRAELVSPFTTDLNVLRNRLMFTHGTGRTALFDAIYLGLSEMRGAHNSRKALLILSDGGENHSRYSERDIREYLREADVQLYAIGIYEPLADRFRTPEEGEGPALLDELAEMSGGRVFPVRNLNELPDIATKISMELRNQYVVGYRPSDRKKDGKWRKIKIRLRPPRGLPPLRVYYRRGYYAPGP